MPKYLIIIKLTMLFSVAILGVRCSPTLCLWCPSGNRLYSFSSKSLYVHFLRQPLSFN